MRKRFLTKDVLVAGYMLFTLRHLVPDTSPDGWVAVLVDVDERHRSEDSLRKQNRLLVRLNEVGNLLIREGGIESALQMTLDAVIEATHADFGTLHLFDNEMNSIRMVADALTQVSCLPGDDVWEYKFSGSARIALTALPLVS